MFYVPFKTYKKTSSFLLMGVFLLQIILSTITPVYAVYTESTTDTFVYYKQKIEGVLQDMEREFRVNNTVTDATINNIRSLVQEAYYRLPDRGELANTNTSITQTPTSTSTNNHKHKQTKPQAQ